MTKYWHMEWDEDGYTFCGVYGSLEVAKDKAHSGELIVTENNEPVARYFYHEGRRKVDHYIDRTPEQLQAMLPPGTTGITYFWGGFSHEPVYSETEWEQEPYWEGPLPFIPGETRG